jgi:hypothetical protein
MCSFAPPRLPPTARRSINPKATRRRDIRPSQSRRRAIDTPTPPPPMGFFRRISGFLGISKDDADHHDSSPSNAAAAAEFPQDRVAAAAHGTRRGFSVQVPVPVERQGPGPVLVPCPQGDGGVQVARLLYLVKSSHQF